MTEAEYVLWKKINDFELDDPYAAFSFSDRLAKENNWPVSFTLRAIHEYKKFIFLICTSKHPLTPSQTVDEVWHLHLLYTHSYWKEMCQQTLGREIHHGPTRGGKQENEKFTNWYGLTLDAYGEKFGEEPPIDIWPPPGARAEAQLTKIDVSKYWIIRKPYKE